MQTLGFVESGGYRSWGVLHSRPWTLYKVEIEYIMPKIIAKQISAKLKNSPAETFILKPPYKKSQIEVIFYFYNQDSYLIHCDNTDSILPIDEYD